MKLSAWIKSVCKFAGAGDTALYKGKPFWIGAVDLENGTIMEVHSYAKAQQSDFHHSFYFSRQAQENIRKNTWGVFWVDDGEIHLELSSRDPNQQVDKSFLTSAISSQISINPILKSAPWSSVQKPLPLSGD